MSSAVKVTLGVLAGVVVLLFVVLVWALLLRGPGGTGASGGESSTSETSASGEDATATDDGTATESESPSQEPTPTTSESTPAELAPVPDGALELTSFTLPSRNISCSMSESGVICEIGDSTFTPPAGPACDLRGKIVVLSDDGVELPCPETAPPGPDEGAAVLEYGQTSSVGTWLCTSSDRGVECSSRADGTGFTLARASFTSYGPGRLM